ncbi:unnamed protein product [Amoebophrya sp. A25]|nr:unnamed protein product [Amoebophrya sp. A25]|eukprot:GSA25T00015177001.1
MGRAVAGLCGVVNWSKLYRGEIRFHNEEENVEWHATFLHTATRWVAESSHMPPVANVSRMDSDRMEVQYRTFPGIIDPFADTRLRDLD